MPYKHIAAHLKKTELACRLHYHQLSHGSNRRKRTASVSSGSTSMHSPIMHANIPSPIHEASNPGTPATYTYSPVVHHAHLPPASSLLPRSHSSSPQRNLAPAGAHPIAILPKPSPPRRSLSDPLRLDCGVSPTSTSHLGGAQVDMARLSQVYEMHRGAFWSAIAADYGHGVNPLILEQAFRQSQNGNMAPPTPCVSPDSRYPAEKERVYMQTQEKKAAISVSALLGIDASPTSPKERELIRQMEERRGSVGEARMM